jgi:phosphate transport system substrate-binding protein
MKKLSVWMMVLGLVMSGAMASVSPALGAEEAKIHAEGSTTVGPIIKAFAEYYMDKNKGVNITVGESGSGNGAKAIVNSTCDIATMSRFMKIGEFKAAAEKGVMPVAHAVAMDGLPILVHPSNPIKRLTVEQVRKIYTGEITNWKELGGPNARIVAISRDTNSGTYETFAKLVMVKQKIAGGVEYVGSNGAIRARVQKTPAAIGYAGLGFVDRTVKALEINGVYPSQETVVSGRYPISRALYLFTNGYPKLGTHVYALVTLHLSRKGQEIIKAIGFVPVTNYKD